ncbi:MAG: hypothetical protein M9898_14310 [Chitinophagaceae bacterium]|nr:hypothetical protein [Chitinophagaceae bacterium]
MLSFQSMKAQKPDTIRHSHAPWNSTDWKPCHAMEERNLPYLQQFFL